MASDEQPPFELSARLRSIRSWAQFAVLAIVVGQFLGFSHFDSGIGLGLTVGVVGIIVAITAYDFVKLGRRRTPSRW